MKQGMIFKIVASALAVFFIASAIALIIVNSDPTIDGLKMMWIIGYTTDISESDRANVEASGDALAETIESEGMVLVKNAGNTLPLSYAAAGSKKINVFGWSSTSWIPGGSGSGRVTRKDNNFYAETGIINALTKAGIDYNEELYQFYMDSTPELNANPSASTSQSTGDRSQNKGLVLFPGGPSIFGNNRPGWGAGNGGSLKAYDFQFARLIEPKMNEYSATLKSNAESFSEVAIVVLSRVSGESNDLPKVQYKGNAPGNGNSSGGTNIDVGSIIDDATRHYLEISTEEQDMLTYVGANYDKTIVLINSTNTMELGFMDTIPGLDACLIVGGTGVNGATAIPKVLFDKVPVDENGNLDPAGTLVDGITPSGKTIATYAYDLKTAASWANSGDADQSSEGTTSGTGLAPENASKELGQRYYTGVERGMNLYPFGSLTTGSGRDSSHTPTNGNFNAGYRNTGFLGLAYVDYSEGIYVGYKWYETADTMGYWATGTKTKAPAGATGYDAVVQYPFGYGLSYTTFDWELSAVEPTLNSNLKKDDVITLYVKVTNTGTKPGKDVVQAYFTPPYISGGIEKASVNLAAFEKTKVLAPEESQILALKIDVFDMASYDSYNKSGLVGTDGGYILEAGKYDITLRSDAHNLAEPTGSYAATVPYNVPTGGLVYDKDPLTDKAVDNKFTGAAAEKPDYDQAPVDGSKESVPVKYMSRSNFAGTFPKLEPARAITETVKSVNSFTAEMAEGWAERHPGEVPTQGSGGDLRVWDTTKTIAAYEGDAEDEAAMEAWYEETDGLLRTRLTEVGYKLAQDHADPQWKELLDQIALNQLTSETKGTGITIMPGTLGEPAIATIGKPVTRSLDGPNMWSSFANVGRGTGFPQSVVLAQSFNKYLAYRMGLQFGKDAKTGGGNGWLGPGINIHRSPLGGRNYEYYSEDSFLTGMMCSEAVKGAKNMGVYVYLKHLVLYDQDSNRDSLHTWVTEQALREVYLKPFRFAILRYAETGHGATGIMTAYGRIGAVWTGGSYPLITGILRNEWDFNGAILTDWSDHRYFMNMSHALRAGGDNGINCGWDSLIDSTASGTRETGAFLQATRRAAHNIVWTWMQAEYMAANYNPTADGEQILGGLDVTPNFDWISLIVYIYLGLAIAGSGVLIFFAFIKPRMKK